MPRLLSPRARPPSGRGASVLAAAYVGAAGVGFAAAWVAPGCSSLAQVEASALATAYDAACPELSLIPVLGGLLAAACVGEEGAVRAALEHAAATSTPPDAGTPPLAAPAAPSAGTRLGAPLMATRGGKRRQIGRAPVGFTPAQVALAQAHLDAQGAR